MMFIINFSGVLSYLIFINMYVETFHIFDNFKYFYSSLYLITT